MTEAEKDFVRGRVFGDIYDLHHDFRDANGNVMDLKEFAKAVKQGIVGALKALGLEELQ